MMGIKLTPLRDIVVMLQAKMPEKIGALFLSEQHRKGLPYGEVVEVGPEVKKVAVGDKVFFDHKANVCFPYGDDMAILVREEGIYCIVSGEESAVILASTLQH
jgi:co-chaperonin GroES (HSP10)